jgi:hypothetical protein
LRAIGIPFALGPAPAQSHAKVPALDTSTVRVLLFQYRRHFNTQTLLDESETMKYNQFMPAMINRILRPPS